MRIRLGYDREVEAVRTSSKEEVYGHVYQTIRNHQDLMRMSSASPYETNDANKTDRDEG
jgi:hypothetical protein